MRRSPRDTRSPIEVPDTMTLPPLVELPNTAGPKPPLERVALPPLPPNVRSEKSVLPPFPPIATAETVACLPAIPVAWAFASPPAAPLEPPFAAPPFAADETEASGTPITTVRCGSASCATRTFRAACAASSTRAARPRCAGLAHAKRIRVGSERDGRGVPACAAPAACAVPRAIAACAAVPTDRRGIIQRRTDRMRTACVGGYRLPIAAWHAGIARIDAIRASYALIALYNHDLCVNCRNDQCF
jgi:hypothetical protein